MKLDKDITNTTTETLENVRTSYNPFQVVRNAAAVTTSDTVDLTNYGVLLIGVGGDVKVDLAGSGTVTYTLESGEFLPVLVKRVYATGTTATGIVVHW